MRNPDSRHQKVTVARARLGIGVAKDAFGMRGQNIRDPGEDEGRPGDTGGNFGFLYMNEHFLCIQYRMIKTTFHQTWFSLLFAE